MAGHGCSQTDLADLMATARAPIQLPVHATVEFAHGWASGTAMPGPPKDGGPFELSVPGKLEELFAEAGLNVQESGEADCPHFVLVSPRPMATPGMSL